MVAIVLKKALVVGTLAAISTWLSGCQTYEVKMSYKCVSAPAAPNTMCMEWEQVGGVKTPSTCFPGEATVLTRTGSKAMSDLRIGDVIEGYDHGRGEIVYTPVLAWLHRDTHAAASMSAVTVAEGTLVASPKHSLATFSDSPAPASFKSAAYKFASELQEGSYLLTSDGNTAHVKSIARTMGHGLYAPLTGTSNYFVGGPQLKTRVLAHNFAEVRYPRRFEGVVQSMFAIYEFFIPSSRHINQDDAYIHPVASMLMKLFGPLIMDNSPIAEKVQVV
jgi:hypothetical protein